MDNVKEVYSWIIHHISNLCNVMKFACSKLEVFIEHIPRAVMNVYRPGCMQCMQLYTIDVCRLCALCASNRAAIAYTVFVYGHIQGVGVTAYRIYWRGGAKCYE